MATVLLGWELGGGLSHVHNLREVARELAASGHTPVLALKDLSGSLAALRGVPHRLVQAPIWSKSAPMPFAASSYADILAVKGFADVDGLGLMVRAWQSLIDLTGAGLVICDHAPTLCLAAYGQVPSVVMGIGFAVPPVAGPDFPRLAAGTGKETPAEGLLGVVREVQRRRNLPAPTSMPALMGSSARFVHTYAELDAYRFARTHEVVEPFLPPAPPLPVAETSEFFAYLSPDYRGANQILPHLAAAGLRGSAYIRGSPPAMVEAGRRAGVTVYDDPPPLEGVLARAAVLLHHGGLNSAEAALAAGRPQVLLPAHLEHELTARALEGLGAGRGLWGRLEVEAVSVALRDVLESGKEAERARIFSRDLRRRHYRGCLPRIIEHCNQVLQA